MIVTERLNINGHEFIKTCSNKGYKIERDGVLYSEAIDPAGLDRTYTESDVLIETMEDTTSEVEQKAAAYDILMGVNE